MYIIVGFCLKFHSAVCLSLLDHKTKRSHYKQRERAFHLKQRDQENDTDAEKEMIPQVFSELLVYLIETKTNAVDPVVFRLADLVSLYQQRLQQLGVKDHNVNSTRLKDKLLGEIPELESYKKGRDVLLAFKEDVGTVLSKAINYTEAIRACQTQC